MPASNVLLSVNQADIYQNQGANSGITSETSVDFGKGCQQIVFAVTTSDLLVDLTNTSSGTGGANCTRVMAGQQLWISSLQPIKAIKIKASGGTGNYSITAY